MCNKSSIYVSDVELFSSVMPNNLFSGLEREREREREREDQAVALSVTLFFRREEGVLCAGAIIP
jgi:hypothetical protein